MFISSFTANRWKHLPTSWVLQNIQGHQTDIIFRRVPGEARRVWKIEELCPGNVHDFRAPVQDASETENQRNDQTDAGQFTIETSYRKLKNILCKGKEWMGFAIGLRVIPESKTWHERGGEEERVGPLDRISKTSEQENSPCKLMLQIMLYKREHVISPKVTNDGKLDLKETSAETKDIGCGYGYGQGRRGSVHGWLGGN